MPTDLLTVWEGREVWRSLDTDSYAMALRRIHRVAADVESQFEKARCSIGRTIDLVLLAAPVSDPVISIPLAPAAPQPPASPPPSNGRTLGDVYDRFIADPKHQWSKRTQIAHATTRKWVVEVFGEGTALTEITREGCRDFVALLREMPRSAHQRFAEHRDLIHKIGVTGGSVEARIANAAKEATYLFAGVDVAASYTLFNINRAKLEALIHRVFAAAQVDLTVQVGSPVKPRE